MACISLHGFSLLYNHECVTVKHGQLYTESCNNFFCREIAESSEDTTAIPDPWSPPPGLIQIDSEVEVCGAQLCV